MRTVQRTRASLSRDAVTIAAAMVAVGASFGAVTIAYGLPTWVPFVMSTVVFAGGSQFLAVGLFAAGNPLAAVVAGLLLNARHLPFGLAVGGALGPRLRDRMVGSHVLTDEVAAFVLAEPDPAGKRRTYRLIGAALFISWNVGTALGVLLGGATGDPDALGLDAAFPAALLALIMPSLRDRATRIVALTGAAVAVLLTPVLPAGLPILCALLGLVTLFRPGRRTRARLDGDIGAAPAAPADEIAHRFTDYPVRAPLDGARRNGRSRPAHDPLRSARGKDPGSDPRSSGFDTAARGPLSHTDKTYFSGKVGVETTGGADPC